MAMQQSGKPMTSDSVGGGASGSAQSAALSDEQAEQFAADFTPAWDSGGDDDGIDERPPANPIEDTAPLAGIAGAPGAFDKTTLDAVAPAAVQALTSGDAAHDAARAAAAAPVPMTTQIMSTSPMNGANRKQTMIGTAPPANAPSNITAPPAIVPQRRPAEPHQTPSRPPSGRAAAPAAHAVRASRPAPAVARDPFSRGAADETEEFVVKKSSKTIYVVLGALLVAAGVGAFIKLGMPGDDSPKTNGPASLGPAATTAEIPLPPPKADPPSTPPAPTTTVAKADPIPPAAPLAAPPVTPMAAPAGGGGARTPAPAQPRQPRQAGAAAPPPPPVAAAPALPPATPPTPKTPPKPPNGGIVRDSPF